MVTINKIIYRFQDSSKPPRFHRSYTISITPQLIYVIVDSYGNILAEKPFVINQDLFNQLVKTLEECRINYKHQEDSNDQCKGGTSETLECFSDTGNIFSGHMYHCGGQTTGNIAGDMEAFSKAVKDLIPDFSSFLNS